MRERVDPDRGVQDCEEDLANNRRGTVPAPRISEVQRAGDDQQLTDALINGIANNGTTAVLGADTVGNAEGFASGRVVRFGLRLRF